MKILFVSPVARTRSLRKKTPHRILPLMALLLMTIPASVPAQEKSPVPNPNVSGAYAKTTAGTNEVPFQPTRYPKVRVRHVPGPETSPELLRAAREGRRTPAVEVDGVTPKGGKLMRVDESYMIPEFAPPLAKTNAAPAPPSASVLMRPSGCTSKAKTNAASATPSASQKATTQNMELKEHQIRNQSQL